MKIKTWADDLRATADTLDAIVNKTYAVKKYGETNFKDDLKILWYSFIVLTCLFLLVMGIYELWRRHFIIATLYFIVLFAIKIVCVLYLILT